MNFSNRSQLQLYMIKLFFLTFLLNLVVLNAGQKTISVSKNGKVKTIKEALILSQDGTVIIVNGGIYREGNIIIEKEVMIKGINNPIIDGEGKHEVITVKANNVVIEGLTIRNAGISFLQENAGIKIVEANGCFIRNNNLINNFFGIYLSKTQNCIIENNRINSNGVSEASSGNAIHIWYSNNVKVTGNEVAGHRDGIYFEFVRNGYIHKNISRNNIRYGIHFMFSDSCTYSSNIFEENGAGVAVMYTKNVLMENNVFQNNLGPAAYGILLKDISNSLIRNNRFHKNTAALYLEGCNRIMIENNQFLSNGWAVKLMANSMDNVFSGNNFVSNTFDVSTNSRQNFNTFEKNYWSEYKGYDLDKNGIGDVPHRPVKLYSILVEQQPASIALMRSMFINLMDLAESIIPSITPAALKDEKPIMRRIK